MRNNPKNVILPATTSLYYFLLAIVCFIGSIMPIPSNVKIDVPIPVYQYVPTGSMQSVLKPVFCAFYTAK